MTKVLLTGAAGSLGSATFKQLVDAGYDVRATDMTRRPDLPGRIRVGNLLDREFCYELTEDIEVVVHVANHPHAGASNAQRVFNDNVTMNMNVFQAAAESGVTKIMFASSVQAMAGARRGDKDVRPGVPYLPLDGDTPQHPGNAYALSKCAGEMQLRYFAEQKKVASTTAIRFPLLMDRKWFADFKARHGGAASGMSRSLLDEAFSWLSYDDGARLLAAAVKADLPGYRCYFPAHPRPRVQKTVPEIVEQFFAGVPLRKPIEQMDAMVDISRITADTGWTPIDDLWQD